MKAFFYLLKRETWEHPAFYVAPAIVGLIVISLVVTGFVQGVGEHVGYDLMVEEWADEPSQKISLALGWLMGSVAIILSIHRDRRVTGFSQVSRPARKTLQFTL